MRQHDVPNELRIEFNTMLEQLYRLAVDMKAKAAMYFVLVKAEESIRRLVAIVSFPTDCGAFSFLMNDAH